MSQVGKAILCILSTPLAVFARPQTVDSLTSAAGQEAVPSALARWLYSNFGPVGLIFTLFLAVLLFYKLRRSR